MIKNWKDCSIKNYNKLKAVPKDDDMVFRWIAICNDKTLDDVLSQNLTITNEESAALAFMNQPPQPGIMKLKYNLGGRKYRVQLDMDELTTAQYIDAQMLTDYNEQLLDLLAIVLIPDGHKYNTGYSKEDAKKDINEYMSIEDALSVAGFFYKYCNVLRKVMLRRCKRQIRRALRKAPTTEIKEQLQTALERLQEIY